MAYCPDEAGLVVLARDHDELEELIDKAIEERRSESSARDSVGSAA